MTVKKLPESSVLVICDACGKRRGRHWVFWWELEDGTRFALLTMRRNTRLVPGGNPAVFPGGVQARWERGGPPGNRPFVSNTGPNGTASATVFDCTGRRRNGAKCRQHSVHTGYAMARMLLESPEAVRL